MVPMTPVARPIETLYLRPSGSNWLMKPDWFSSV
jgi:hypothetical protein